MRLIILANKQLSENAVFFNERIAAGLEVTDDVKRVVCQSERAMVDTIIIVEDYNKDFNAVVRYLRENSKLDLIPILVVKNADDVKEIISSLLKPLL